ncbi:hypothetical protein D9619_013344 [Psilocybe cf. subviscida]|uniref:DUF6534 domain-containing protein n=1 Tax=Psilocybe cf. subviscida TaxID=2480587 RepID=A0A8H5F975_9AGAR|nr:hypothetical protein D9619_013344 [Psilocybe cf. subviscida]
MESIPRDLLNTTLGVFCIEVVWSSICFGITVVQVYLYYRNFGSDPRYQKMSVATLIILSIALLVLDVYGLYNYAVTNFGNIPWLETVTWNMKLQIAFDTILVICIQVLYALRIWLFSQYFFRLWGIIVCILVTIGAVVAVFLVVATYHLQSWNDVVHMKQILFISFSFSTFLDVLMAVSIFYVLWTLNRGSFSRGNSRAMQISRYVLICGFFTSACSLTAIFLLWTMPNNLVFLAYSFLLPKVYVNSYLALLNVRHIVKESGVEIIPPVATC